MIANYVRVLKLRTDLVHHRTNLERSMNHVEADLAALRVAFVEESNHPPGVGS